MGHLLPGIYFLILGSWGSLHSSKLYWQSRQAGMTRYRSRATHQGSRRIPLESGLKLICFAFHIVAEIVTGWIHFAMWNNANHITMIMFFIGNCLMELTYFYKFPAPPHLDYVSGALAYGMEAFIFSGHVHGKSMIEMQVHSLLYITSTLTAVLFIVELSLPHVWWVTMARHTSICLHGTWFLQTAMVLFPHQLTPSLSDWPESDHKILTMVWAWHLLGVLVWQAFFVWTRVKNVWL